MRRDVQLGLLAGDDDRAIGPLPPSVVIGDNGALIAAVAPLYLTGSVLDVTYGRGLWWSRFRPDVFQAHDLALDGVDFRELPHEAGSWDSVCFDPPYVPRTGPNTSNGAGDFRDRYGLAEARTRRELDELIAAGMAEVARVARRFVLVKCCDYVNGRQFHLGHVAVVEAARSCGLREFDLIVHAPGRPGPGGGQIEIVQRVRRYHSYLLVFKPVGGDRKEKPE